MLSRRALLALSAAGVLAPRPLWSAPAGASDRRFVFIYCFGGWDPFMFFAPKFGLEAIDMESDAEAASIGDLHFVDHPDRPSVRAFLEAYGDRTALLNGFEVRSITHERCQRLLYTGTGGSDIDDFAVTLAARADSDLPFPHLVVGGPAFTSRYASEVVRLGGKTQLSDLLTGDVFDQASLSGVGSSATAEDAVDSFLRGELGRYGAQDQGEARRQLAEAYGISLDRAALARDQAHLFAAAPGDTRPALLKRLDAATGVLSAGYARCVQVQYNGVYEWTFDTHANNSGQSQHWEELFGVLSEFMALLDTTPGQDGEMLADNTTVVLLSEMGRTPLYNSQAGRDHWTFTSAIFIGAGVQGGQTIGAYDDRAMGEPIVLETGESSASGVPLTPKHLGATLLALGDVDPAEWTDAEPVAALLS